MHLKAFKTSFFNHFLFTISIRSRLLLYFILLILLPTSIISITIYNTSTGIITQKINSSLEEKLNIINADITQKFEAINDTYNKIYLNNDLIHILSSQHPSDTTEIISEMSIMDKVLSNYSVTNTTQNLLIPKIFMLNRPEYLLYSFTDKVSDLSGIEKEMWYTKLPFKAEYTVVGLSNITVSSTKINTIKIAKRLFALDDMRIQFSGVLTVDIGTDYFNAILYKSKPTTDSSIFIVDSNSSIIISSDAALLGKDVSKLKYITEIMKSKNRKYGSFIEELNSVKNLVAYEKIASLDWTVVTLTHTSELNKELISFNRVIYIVMVFCGILALFMALLLSEDISYPIRKLVNSMKVVQSGNFDISLEYKRNDEFAYLFKNYKNMVTEIRELIDKLYVSEVRKKEAELKSLQAQINPHFLYNTLDSINWMALELNATNISIMVTSLSNFFRYSLSKGNNVIPLGDEIKQVESYLKIQQMRFQDRLEYFIDYPNEILGCLTVKLIMQPIVENSIIHGINKRGGKGIIKITALKYDSIIEIRICDNGIGADIDELNSILEGNSSTISFGIKNVNDRIKSYFGDEYGIKFFNNEDFGVTAILRFPAVKKMEGLYVKDGISRG